jgi:predicted nucleic-acid-binding protein
MLKNTKLIDTNIILRFLVRDDETQYKQVYEFFNKASLASLEIPDVIIFETIFALDTVYDFPKSEIIDKIEVLIESNKFILNRIVLRVALDYYERFNYSFVDSYLIAKSILESKKVITFDKGIIKKHKDIAKSP